MARRNLLRSLATASLLVLTGAGGLVVAAPPAPAGAADAFPITVTVRDDGFSQTDIHAVAGSKLTFQLDAGAVRSHTLAWEQGQMTFRFNQQGRTYITYGPLRAGTLRFYDADAVSGPDVAGPYAGILTVSPSSPQPPDTTSSSTSTSTTVTTVRPTTTTSTPAPPSQPTTTVFPPTTQPTASTAIRPLLVADPAPTTTTTAPKKKDPPSDKGKAKTAAAETPTTAAPAPPGPPALEPVFDPSTLTPGPLPSPDDEAAAAPGQAAASNLDAAAVSNLLNPDKPADDGARLLLLAVVAFALLVVVALVWGWNHRSSRYFPA
jgi:hypothetical protein